MCKWKLEELFKNETLNLTSIYIYILILMFIINMCLFYINVFLQKTARIYFLIFLHIFNETAELFPEFKSMHGQTRS